MRLDKELEFARGIAARAGEVALRHLRDGLRPEAKPDLSPVTAADRECEQVILAAIASAFPSDGVLGEEGADRKSASGRRWIIDPIDGTREFVRGNPAWAVLIALEDGADVVLGVAHFPSLAETYWAVRGGGAWRNGDRLSVSLIARPEQAVLCINGFAEILAYPFAPRLLDWMKQFWAVRSYGGCLDAMMVASGRADAWIEPSGKAWDFAALKVIGEEAGAVFFNFDGGRTIYGGNCALSAPGLEVELRRFVTGTKRS